MKAIVKKIDALTSNSKGCNILVNRGYLFHEK